MVFSVQVGADYCVLFLYYALLTYVIFKNVFQQLGVRWRIIPLQAKQYLLKKTYVCLTIT